MLGRQRLQIALHNIAGHKGEVVKTRHGFRQDRIQTPIQFHGNHFGRALGKLLCQRPDPRPDLQYACLLIGDACLGNIPGHPVLNEKILAQRLGKAKSVTSQQILNIVAVT